MTALGAGGGPRPRGHAPEGPLVSQMIATALMTVDGIAVRRGGLIPGARRGGRDAILLRGDVKGDVPVDPIGIGQDPPLHQVHHAAVRAALAFREDGADVLAGQGAELVLVYKRRMPALPRFLLRPGAQLRLPPPRPWFLSSGMWHRFRSLLPEADPSGQAFPAFLWDLVESQ